MVSNFNHCSLFFLPIHPIWLLVFNKNKYFFKKISIQTLLIWLIMPGLYQPTPWKKSDLQIHRRPTRVHHQTIPRRGHSRSKNSARHRAAWGNYPTVDASEIRPSPPGMLLKPCINNGMNCQPHPGAGFLNFFNSIKGGSNWIQMGRMIFPSHVDIGFWDTYLNKG